MGSIARFVSGTLLALAAALAPLAAGVPTAAAADPGERVAVAGLVPASVNDFRFASMDVDYSLTRADDGTSRLLVRETFVAVFPDTDQNRGMQRIIPDTYLDAPLFPELVSVTDAEGRQRPAETESDDGWWIVTSAADGYVHGEQTYVFTYELRNVTRSFDDTGADEFYWNVNGLDWRQPFGEVTARLRVDGELAAALTGEAACYVGARGATERCGIEVGNEAGSTVITARAVALEPRQTVTIAVGFERGTFTPFDPSYFASGWGWAQTASALALVAALGSALLVRARVLRDAPGRPTIIAEYTPPRAIDALESAVLLGRTTKAIPAEVLEQAVVGSIRIVEGEKRFGRGVRLQAHLVDPSRADGDGRMLLKGLFGANAPIGSVYEFGRQDSRLSSAARSILAAANKELTRRGLRRSVPRAARAWPLIVALLAVVAVVASGIAALGDGVIEWVPLGVIVASVVLVFVIATVLGHKPLTPLGAETRDHLAGLREFIQWAEADRIRMLQSPSGAERVPVDPGDPRQMLRIYEKLLPYAVVFGQEKEWAQRLAVLYETTDTPGWYVGSSGFSAAAFSAGIGSLSASTSSSSSSSGGSSGGGSAGGGGGGGGGGGV